MTDVYRSAASVLLLRPAEGYQILLLRKPRKRDAWQLPQGGVESGETVEQAALRELHEEAGIRECEVLGTSENVYQYDFPPSYRRFRPDNVCGQRISYVFALAPRDAEVVVDGQEIDEYVWISPGQLSHYIKRKEYLILIEKLLEEALPLLKFHGKKS